jgi:hypothetical protein
LEAALAELRTISNKELDRVTVIARLTEGSQIRAGAQFALASHYAIARAGTNFSREVAYLLKAEYRLVGDGKAGGFLVPR